jgi:ectoine hydroxylase-related dioxygenase (phytanoyl-CoA dioxygenase family)
MSDQLMDEMFTCLASGPGVFVVKRCVEDLDVLVRANAAFKTIIDREREGAGGSKGDHFAEAGRNDRIWNSFQKHAEVDPESFVKYYSNDVLWVLSMCSSVPTLV